VLLVGDHKQLPATVLSVQCQEKGYSRSLFQRLKELGWNSRLLDTQYRCSGKDAGVEEAAWRVDLICTLVGRLGLRAMDV